ncbi:hypothetical protein [Oceanivirga salmonicida]|uniref:hypothetical protein n=1 Tax=Oceanivirga salmonicida TaxID=1769291 RepID=UPI00082E0950|nr:hypothetical protein [Oceanivirga salmonicida]
MLDYEVTLRKEVLREKSAGILADYDRYIEKYNIKETDKNPINSLLNIVGDIYRNIFKPEYDSMEKLNEANIKLDLATKVLIELS